MPSQAVYAFGTLLKIGDGATPTEAFVTVAEVTGLDGPNLTADTVELTSHSSTSAFKEYLVTLLDAGEVTCTINYVPTDATHNPTTGLLSKYAARAKTNFKLVFPNGAATTWTFSGFITHFQPHAPVADKLAADVTIKITGAPTLA